MKWPSDSTLRSINRSLLVVIIICNGFLLLAPIWPKFSFIFRTHITKPVSIDLQSQDSLAGIDKSFNHIIIPRLQLDQKILEGENENTVHSGVWRRPAFATPGQNNNTVLVGHRFTYIGPSVFYHLDKVQANDDIVVAYSGKLYVYRVYNTRTVEPDDQSVEAPASSEKLTIYTCTPLGSIRYRLVIDSRLERVL